MNTIAFISLMSFPVSNLCMVDHLPFYKDQMSFYGGSEPFLDHHISFQGYYEPFSADQN